MTPVLIVVAIGIVGIPFLLCFLFALCRESGSSWSCYVISVKPESEARSPRMPGRLKTEPRGTNSRITQFSPLPGHDVAHLARWTPRELNTLGKLFR
jgi:hypothetical protein